MGIRSSSDEVWADLGWPGWQLCLLQQGNGPVQDALLDPPQAQRHVSCHCHPSCDSLPVKPHACNSAPLCIRSLAWLHELAPGRMDLLCPTEMHLLEATPQHVALPTTIY